MIIIPKQTVRILYDIIKALKSTSVLLYKGIVIPVEVPTLSFRYVDMNPIFELTGLEYIHILCQEFLEYMSPSEDIEFDIVHGTFKQSDKIINPYPIEIQDLTSLIYKCNEIMNIMCSNTEVLDNDIRQDPNFMQYPDLKSDSGQFRYIKDGFVMLLYANAIPINKPDTVQLTIHSIDAYSFLSVFYVNKKKFNIVHALRFLGGKYY